MIRRMILRCLFLMQLDRLMRRFHRDRILILMYHGFLAEPTGSPLQNHEGIHISISKFRRQVRYLKRHHSIIAFDTLIQCIERGEPLPPYSVLITMDDGYESNHSLAFPILREFGVPSLVAVTTGFVESRSPLWNDRVEWAVGHAEPGSHQVTIQGEMFTVDLRDGETRLRAMEAIYTKLKRIPQEQRAAALDGLEARLQARLTANALPPHCRPLDWESILDMTRSGLVSVGNHTHSHYILSRCTPETQQREIETAHQLLVQQVGPTLSTFCYPNGGPEDFDDHTKVCLSDLGYRAALTTVPGYNLRSSDLLELKRVAISDAATMDDFRMILYGGLRRLRNDLGGFVRGHRT